MIPAFCVAARQRAHATDFVLQWDEIVVLLRTEDSRDIARNNPVLWVIPTREVAP
jgi:hypothetical protein